MAEVRTEALSVDAYSIERGGLRSPTPFARSLCPVHLHRLFVQCKRTGTIIVNPKASPALLRPVKVSPPLCDRRGADHTQRKLVDAHLGHEASRGRPEGGASTTLRGASRVSRDTLRFRRAGPLRSRKPPGRARVDSHQGR